MTRDAAKAFMTAHLGRWAMRFATEVVDATALPYYTTAAALLAAWIKSEIAALGATPAPIDAMRWPLPNPNLRWI